MPSTTLTGTHVLAPADADTLARLDFLRQRGVVPPAAVRTRAQAAVDAVRAESDRLGYGRPTLAVTPTTLPRARVGVAYSQLVTATGGMPPYTWRLASGTLPAGITLGTATGQLTGTPTAAGSAPLALVVTDAAGQTAQGLFTLSVDPATTPTPLSIPAFTLPAARVGTPFTHALAAGGGTPPYTWNLQAGTLPAGVTLSAAGQLSGTPTAAGTFTPAFRATDAAGATAQAAGTLTVAAAPPLVLTAPALPAAQVGTPYSHTLAATGGVPPYMWSVAAGTPPAGLALSGGGVLSGTPTAAGTASFTARVGDAAGQQAQTPLTLAVAAGPVVTDPLAKPALTTANFRYKGRFRIQHILPSGLSTAFSMGAITTRHVNNKLHVIMTSQNQGGGQVFEVQFPGVENLVTSPSATPVTAQLYKEWGDIYGGKKWVENEGGIGDLSNGVWTVGLDYDEADNRLYWDYGHWYNQVLPYNPSLGYSVLHDAYSWGEPFGPWKLSGVPEKYTRGGTCRVPDWFAARYLGGKKRLAGFGGYWSGVNSSSLGPAAVAFDPAVLPSTPAKGEVPCRVLIGYPYGTGRAKRNPNYVTWFEGDQSAAANAPYQAKDGVGQWTWVDHIYGAGAWVETPTAQGLLFIAKVGHGKVSYDYPVAMPVAHGGGEYAWYVYHPKDLADVAEGRLQPHAIQPRSYAAHPQLPLSPQDVAGWAGDGHGNVGMTYNARAGLLLVRSTSEYLSGVELLDEIKVFEAV